MVAGAVGKAGMSGFVERLAETGRAGEDFVRRAHPVGGKGKRAVDLAVSLAALVALWPLFLMIVLVMKATDPGPVFFAHERIGFNGRRFRCLKFRSMVVESDAALQALLRRDPEAAREWDETQKLGQEPPIQTFGGVLCATSLAPRPQLINMPGGDMRSVGPRPIRPARKAP